VGPTESTEAEHIGKVGQLATDFKASNHGNSPKNIGELKTWAIQSGKANDDDFVSTRDKEQYVLEPMSMSRGGAGMANANNSPMASKTPVIIHEATGMKGKKFVIQGVSPTGSEMTEEGLKYLTHGPGDQNAKRRP
jgi:hypothetical protein